MKMCVQKRSGPQKIRWVASKEKELNKKWVGLWAEKRRGPEDPETVTKVNKMTKNLFCRQFRREGKTKRSVAPG